MYIPNQGDIIYLTLNPQSGHEQSGRRPVLVISRYSFNKMTKLAVVCPITNTERNVPTHIKIENAEKTTGYIMCEQVKSLDLKTRKPQYKDKVDNDTLYEVTDVIKGFIDLTEAVQPESETDDEEYDNEDSEQSDD